MAICNGYFTYEEDIANQAVAFHIHTLLDQDRQANQTRKDDRRGEQASMYGVTIIMIKKQISQ